MKSERTILELLILLRENIEECWIKYSSAGLGAYVHKLGDDGLITASEKDKLLNYVYAHRPDESSGLNDLWWYVYELWPRIESLDGLIKLKS